MLEPPLHTHSHIHIPPRPHTAHRHTRTKRKEVRYTESTNWQSYSNFMVYSPPLSSPVLLCPSFVLPSSSESSSFLLSLPGAPCILPRPSLHSVCPFFLIHLLR